MKIPRHSSPDTLARIDQWIDRTGEIFVAVEYPHSGASGDRYFIRSAGALRELLEMGNRAEIEYFVMRDAQYPVRGVLEGPLLERALAVIPESEWWDIVSLDAFPSKMKYLESGDSHDELRRHFEEFRGVEAGIGVSPLWHDDEWVREHPEELITAFRRRR